jgi:hypothetical protein
VPDLNEVYQQGKELYKKGKDFLKQRNKNLTPDKTLVIGAITALATYGLLPIQLACAALIHEIEKDQTDESVRILAIAIMGLATLLSIASEIPTLHKRGYSASFTSSGVQAVTKKSILKSSAISVGTHLVTTPILVGASPGNVLAILTADLGRLGFENAAGVVVGLTIWRVFFNAIIHQVDSKVLVEPAQNIYYRLRPDAYAPMRDARKLE